MSIEFYPSKNCVFSAMRAMLMRYSIEITDIDVFSLCGGLQLTYREDCSEFAVPSIYDYFKRLGALVGTVNPHDFMIEYIQEVLKQYKCILVHARTEKLIYNPFYTREENKYRTHFILINGYDRENACFNIFDPHCSMNNTYSIGTMEGKLSVEQLKECFILGYYLERTECHLHGAKNAFIIGLKCFLEEERPNGVRGILPIQQFIAGWTSLFAVAPAQMKDKCVAINYNIKICSLKYLLQYYALGLISYGDKQLTSEIIKRVGEQIVEWENIAFIILISGVKGDFTQFPGIIERCSQLLEEMVSVFAEGLGILSH